KAAAYQAAPPPHGWRHSRSRSLQLQQGFRVAEIDLTLVAFSEAELLDRADAFADEHRAALRIERAVAREDDAVDAEERDAAGERRRGAAEHRIAVEQLEVLDRRALEALQHLGLVTLGAARAELRPERLGAAGEVRQHAAAVMRDDAQLRQPVEEAREHHA